MFIPPERMVCRYVFPSSEASMARSRRILGSPIRRAESLTMTSSLTACSPSPGRWPSSGCWSGPGRCVEQHVLARQLAGQRLVKEISRPCRRSRRPHHGFRPAPHRRRVTILLRRVRPSGAPPPWGVERPVRLMRMILSQRSLSVFRNGIGRSRAFLTRSQSGRARLPPWPRHR